MKPPVYIFIYLNMEPMNVSRHTFVICLFLCSQSILIIPRKRPSIIICLYFSIVKQSTKFHRFRYIIHSYTLSYMHFDCFFSPIVATGPTIHMVEDHIPFHKADTGYVCLIAFFCPCVAKVCCFIGVIGL